ncbi:MAG: hypothetical protein WC322_06635, partial [Candidatus Paceibacterota bacterium]|jgi:hypothetical protein
MDSQNVTPAAITRNVPHVVHVSDLDLPVADTAPGTAANLTISVRSDGTNDCLVNELFLVPLDYGYFQWHPDVVTTEIDQLDVGPSGIFMDGVTDTTDFLGSVLTPEVLAAHSGTLISTASPTGNTWPTNWGRTDDADVTADTARFEITTAVGEKYAWFAATTAATPVIVPGQWYQIDATRDVDSWTAGSAIAYMDWLDIDGNLVRTDTLGSTAADDAAPVALTYYALAPEHAARGKVRLGAGVGANLTVFWSAVSFRRCPLRLIVVADEASGTLTSNLFPVHLTVSYVPRYEVAR